MLLVLVLVLKTIPFGVEEWEMGMNGNEVSKGYGEEWE